MWLVYDFLRIAGIGVGWSLVAAVACGGSVRRGRRR